MLLFLLVIVVFVVVIGNGGGGNGGGSLGVGFILYYPIIFKGSFKTRNKTL